LLLGMLLVTSGVAGAQPTAPAQPLPTAPTAPIAPPGVSDGRMVLTLERAVEIALQQQPILRQRRASAEAAQGRVDQARVAQRPTLNLNGSVTMGSSRSGFCQPVKDG